MSDFFKSLPKAGYGQSRRLADHLGIHTTLVSQVLNDKKTFTPEQAVSACEFFALSEIETDYFLLLVQLDRAGSPALKKNIHRQIEKIREQSKELVNRLSSKHKLSEEDRAIFYSDWSYSAVRQMMAINGYQQLDSIADYFGFSRRQTKNIIEFLLRVGLCVEVNDGAEAGGKEGKGTKFKVGPTTTHIESSSPWVRLHHMNWRQKSIEALNAEGHAKLHYTAPMTLSKADAELVREQIVKLLESVDSIIEPSPSETLFCLNIDWFQVDR
jgi:uncharacterized protein (TIGR02147 family)